MPTPKDLLILAPHYHRWVDNLLAQHAANTRPLNLADFPRLSAYFNPITLNEARYVIVRELPTLPFAQLGLATPKGMDDNFAGITFRTTYFLLPSHAANESTHFHELVHVVQHIILGQPLFPLVYAHELLSKGYRSNFLEATAYELQSQFENQTTPFPVEPAVAAKIGFHLPQLLNQLLKKI